MEKQFSSPNVKHKWLFRLMQARRDYITLENARDSYVHNILNNDNPLQLSKSVVEKKIHSQAEYRILVNKIKEQEILIAYLDAAVNKIFTQIGFDFKNLVELMKMEQL